MHQKSIRIRKDQEEFIDQESIQLSKFVRNAIDDRIDRDMRGQCDYDECRIWVPETEDTEENVISSGTGPGEALGVPEGDVTLLCNDHLADLRRAMLNETEAGQ